VEQNSFEKANLV